MSRNLDTITQTAVAASVMWPVWIIRLDVITDPVYVHTGIGTINFAAGQTGDAGLDGYSFQGVGNVGSIGAITDSATGSSSVIISLPGIQLTNDYLNQFINKADLWQGQRGWVWLAAANANGVVLGRPMRIKTGRIDKLPITIDPDSGTGTIDCTLESQESYSNQPSYTRYSEQQEIDLTDTSQVYIADLANKSPVIGDSSSDAAGYTTGGITTTQSSQEKALASYG